jgi:hypothetical protein
MTQDDMPIQEDPLAAAILSALAALPPGKSLDPQDIAKAIAAGRAKADDPPDLWRRYLGGVRQQAIHLGRKGRIAVLRAALPGRRSPASHPFGPQGPHRGAAQRQAGRSASAGQGHNPAAPAH